MTTEVSRKIGAAAALVAALLLLSFAPSGATVVIRKDLRSLSVEAETVVLGRVIKRESRYGEDGRMIFTYTTVKVERTLRGREAAGEIVIRTLGGTVGEAGMVAQGVCSFTPGEETVLFLKKTRGGVNYMVSGLSQGKLPVVRGASGEALVLTGAPTPGLAFAKSAADDGTPEKEPAPRLMKLDEFERLVRSYE